MASVILPASAGHAEPSIGDVQQRLDTLYHQAESAQERLNALNIQLDDKRELLTTLREDLPAQRRHYRNVSNMVAAMAADEAQNVESQLAVAHPYLMSDDPTELLDRIAAEDALSRKKGETLNRLTAVSRRLHQRQRQVSSAVDELRTDQQQATEEEDAVDANVAQAKDLLANLEAERRAELRAAQRREAAQRAARLREARAQAQAVQEQAQRAARLQAAQRASRSRPQPQPQTAPVSSRAARAVDFAMAQVGEAYVYGAAGPDAWDCSGLTMKAWGSAGVSLPHSSSSQYYSGPHVSTSDLQPGDLVFYYSPISHVAMYIGNGQIVQAANPSDGVNVAAVNSMPISGAARPG